MSFVSCYYPRHSSPCPSFLDKSQWSPERPRSLTTLQAHNSCVYQAVFSPHDPDILASCSTDGTLKLFDLRVPAYAPATNSFTTPLSAAVLTVPASGTEILSLDWNKYKPWTLASAGVDKMIKVWDCRMVQLVGRTGEGPAAGVPGGYGSAVGGACEVHLVGHEYAVRKVQWSPHRPDLLASASYDMTCRVYVLFIVPSTSFLFPSRCSFSVFTRSSMCCDHYSRYIIRPVIALIKFLTSYLLVSVTPASVLVFANVANTRFQYSRWSTTPTPTGTHLVYIHDPHTEFVVGCGWSLYEEGVLATCSWDSRVNVFHI